jgi:hypothetical protein
MNTHQRLYIIPSIGVMTGYQSKLMLTGGVYKENLGDLLPYYTGHLREKGWLAKTYFKVFDEPQNDEEFAIVDKQAALIRELAPGAKTLACVAEARPDLGKSVDKWVPRLNNYSAEAAENMRRQGSDIWWYWCCIPYMHPYPNYFINYSAVDPRVLEWMNWKYKVKGILYWALNVWSPNIKKTGEPKWPEAPWDTYSYATFNGEGNLTYPSPDGDLLSSIRLESLRDGAEDYEYFYLLDSLIDKLASKQGETDFVRRSRQLLELTPVVKSNIDYSNSPGDLTALRARIAESIEHAAAMLDDTQRGK